MNSPPISIDRFHDVSTDRCDRSEALPRAGRFPLGQVIIHGNTTLRLRTEWVLTALRRQAECDWGDVFPEDAIANDLALQQGGPLFSAYGFARHRFWVITEADRSLTTLLLPDDY